LEDTVFRYIRYHMYPFDRRTIGITLGDHP